MAQPQTDDRGQIVKRNPNGADKTSLAGMLQKMGPEIARALPRHVSPERMGRIALTALRANADLQACTPASFLASVLSAAQLGLEPNTPLGHAYLIPYKRECTLQLGYQGMMDLARRSGQVTAIYAYPVYEGDKFAYELGLNPDVRHTPSDDAAREDKPLTHVYAVAKLKDGEPVFTVLTRSQVEKYKRRSRASSNGPWVTDYVAMALKTAIRRLFTWLPKSAEMALASALDEAADVRGSIVEAVDPAVAEALASHGVDMAEDGTGEKQLGDGGRQPGEEG